MNRNLKQAKSIAYLRQLCCSGLDRELVIQEFLTAVKSVIPSDANAFINVEKQFAPNDFITDFNPGNQAEFLDIMAAYWTPGRIIKFASWFMHHPVFTDPKILDEKYYSSDLYHYGLKNYGLHHLLNTQVMHVGKPIGMMSLGRPQNSANFNEYEQAVLVRLMPYVAHAMTAQQPPKDIVYCEQGTNGMMVMTTHGTILYQSQSAKKLLNLASNPVININAAERKAALIARLTQLCHNLDTIFRGEEAAPPSWCFVNGLGRFIFRACWLNTQAYDSNDLIGLMIEHQEPLLLKILRALEQLPLSPIQKEVATLMAQGASNENICQQLHIKLTTAKDHIRKIFIRLDIENREQLLPKLMACEQDRLIQFM